jgi:hypothetical protein
MPVSLITSAVGVFYAKKKLTPPAKFRKKAQRFKIGEDLCLDLFAPVLVCCFCSRIVKREAITRARTTVSSNVYTFENT